MVTENLKKVEEKIEKACERSGRSRSDVTLIAVSKTKPIEMMQEAMQAGVSIFGENKVQEIVKKEVELPKNVEWHLIGHLQRNKVRQIAGKVARIHSVDSLRLAEQIQKEYEKIGEMADRSGLTYLWLGAKLQSDTEEWKQAGWITGEDWTFDNWYPGEPSRQDADGTKELFLCMWKAKYNEEEIGWTFNDQRNDIVGAFPKIAGKVVYVCEYERETNG